VPDIESHRAPPTVRLCWDGSDQGKVRLTFLREAQSTASVVSPHPKSAELRDKLAAAFNSQRLRVQCEAPPNSLLAHCSK
jgi:hypothetical protein